MAFRAGVPFSTATGYFPKVVMELFTWVGGYYTPTRPNGRSNSFQGNNKLATHRKRYCGRWLITGTVLQDFIHCYNTIGGRSRRGVVSQRRWMAWCLQPDVVEGSMQSLAHQLAFAYAVERLTLTIVCTADDEID